MVVAADVVQQVDFVPLHDYVLFEEIPAGMTPGGVVIPDTVKGEDMSRGRVIATGPGYRADNGELIPTDVKAGDIVYMAFAYQKPLVIKLNGKKYGVARSRDLIALQAT